MGWPERGQLAAPGAIAPIRLCADHAQQGQHLTGIPWPGAPAVDPDQCQVCHPAAPLTYSLERQLQIERAEADGPAAYDPLGQAAADLDPSDLANDARFRALDACSGVDCPQCEAPAGERCRPPRGMIVHAARADAWQAAGKPAPYDGWRAPAGQSDDDARADQIACARDLQELAARNLAAAGEDLAEARRAVAEAQQECDQAAAALSRVDPGAPPLRTVADIRGQVEKWEDTYTKTAAGLREGSARDSMRAAAGAMSSVLRYIDGES